MAKRGYKLQEHVAHTSDVNCLYIGKKTCRIFLTGGDDCKVNVWAIGKPTSLMSLSGHTSSVQSVTFDSAEGLVLAGSSNGTIKLWELEEAKIVRTLTGHRSSCTSADFHPFGEFFASGSLDTNLKIWDIRRKGCIHTYKGHTRGIRTIKFTPDGRWVVTGGEDNVVKIWDLTAGKLLHDFKLHNGIICCIDFHPFEFLLATGSADQTIKFWDLETLELIGSAGPEATGVRAMAFHPDGRTLLCGLEENLKVFSWEPIICHNVVDMGWSTLGDLSIHGGKVVGCSYHQNYVGVWIADISAESSYNDSPSVSTQLFHSEASNPKESFVEATNLIDESNKALASSIQHSNPAALVDGLIEFGKDIERANSVVKSNILKLVSAPQGSKDAKNSRQSFGGDEPLSTPGLDENLGATILESQESAISEAGGLIIDSSVGEIDLSNMQVMDNEDLVELKELGSGGFGTVYHGKWRGIDVAIKRIKKSSVVGQQSGQYRLILESLREAGILSKLQHPNVVSLYGFVLNEASSTLAIVTELVGGGSLRNILHHEDIYLDRCKRLAIAKGAASGMEYLHLKNIVHFDLKCDNLLVDLNNPSHPICKVTDFGLSKIKKNTLVTGSFRGTLPWMAPELLKRGNNKVSEKIDVYSFGIVMWEILTGKVPYDDMPQGEILGGIYDNTLRPPVPASCDPEWRELMEQCWDGDPQQRPSFTQIVSRLHRMLVVSQAEASEYGAHSSV